MRCEAVASTLHRTPIASGSLLTDATSDHCKHPSMGPRPRKCVIEDPAFSSTRLADIERNILLLAGDLDIAAARSFEASCAALDAQGRPVVIDCSALSFIDCFGVRLILRALEDPLVRLANVPAHMSRVLRLMGLAHIVENRTRFDVAVAIPAGFDAASADRIASVFANANGEGCCYDLVWLPFDLRTSAPQIDDRRFHCLVVPPLHRWLGVSKESVLTRWIQELVMRSDLVVGVGTGLAVLAATGLLDGHRIAARNCAPGFAALTPQSTLCDVTAMSDGRLGTTFDLDAACAHCVSIIGDDYGNRSSGRKSP